MWVMVHTNTIRYTDRPDGHTLELSRFVCHTQHNAVNANSQNSMLLEVVECWRNTCVVLVRQIVSIAVVQAV